jgi:hypothetical protein
MITNCQVKVYNGLTHDLHFVQKLRPAQQLRRRHALRQTQPTQHTILTGKQRSSCFVSLFSDEQFCAVRDLTVFFQNGCKSKQNIHTLKQKHPSTISHVTAIRSIVADIRSFIPHVTAVCSIVTIVHPST